MAIYFGDQQRIGMERDGDGQEVSISIAIGEVVTLDSSSKATASITGDYPNYKVNFGIPQGAAGTSAQPPSFSIGTVTTLTAGSAATVKVSGAYPNLKLDFGIPSGAAGTNATATSAATPTSSGLMSSTDKAKLDTFNAPAFNVVASGGRPVGTAYTVDANRNARVSYTISYTLTATLTVGQTLQIVATVDGKEVARMADGILLGLAGNLQKTKSFSFDVPAGKSVLLTKTGTSSITATVISGQEVLY
ncbi:hypothetical protein ACRPHP_07245 [Pantoea allii]|uniref:hypothetical protein n=1 Tax=Pantoea allii TaxID=574096 RepID=UPI003D7B8CA1